MHMCVSTSVNVTECLSRPEEDVGCFEAGVTSGFVLPVWVLGTKHRSLEDQQVLLAAKPSLQAFLSWRRAEDQTHSLALAMQMP